MNIEIGERHCSRLPFQIGIVLALLAAVQNSFFDEMFVVAGMDAVSLLLSVLLLITFAFGIAINRIRFYTNDLILILYIFSYILLNFAWNGISSHTLLLFRTTVYFITGFSIFKNIDFDAKESVKSFRITGFANSIICLYFYIININKYGNGFRDVSINLYFSILALMLYAFVEIENENRIEKYIFFVLASIAIVSSQQRTQIIPLIIIILLYLISRIKELSARNIVEILMIIVVVYLTVSYIQKIGVWELVIARMQYRAITANNSTLSLRIYTAMNYFKNMNFFQWLFGTGFSGMSELELLPANYIYKYGISGSIVIIATVYLPSLVNGIEGKGMLRMLVISILIISVGGIISGLGGQNGQFFLGAILGLMQNEFFIEYSQDGVKINFPLCGGG